MRSLVVGFTSILLFMCGVAQVATASSSDAKQSAGPSATDAQVQQLLSFQRWQFRETPKVGRMPDVSDCVTRNTISVDPGNPAWNASDPRWATMSKVIGKDCTAQNERLFKQVAPAMKAVMHDSLAHAYVKRLSKADADALIRYYESDEGHRFLEFQRQVSYMSGIGMRETFGGHVTRAVGKPSPDLIKSRMELLRLSRLFAVQIVAAEDGRSTGGDTTGTPAIAIMMVAIASTQGDALDEIRHTYSTSLPGFAAFAASREENEELRAFADADNAMVNVASGSAREMDPTENGNLEKWRTLYHSLPADGTATSRR
jgi:hypothetical protein